MPRPLRTLLVAAASWGALLLLPATGQAQGAPFTVEARGGVGIPVGGLADGTGVGEGVASGPLFGAEVTLLSGRWRTLYAGFTQARFPCQDAGCPLGDDYVATGVNAGIRVGLLPGRTVIPWVGVGGVTTRLESPGVPGSPAGVSSQGYGVEAGAGLWVRVGRSLALTPSVRYTRARADLPGGATLTLGYVVADLGLTLVFG